MRTLLQDKRVVALLSLAAILTVGWRVSSSWHKLFPVTVASASVLSPAPQTPLQSNSSTELNSKAPTANAANGSQASQLKTSMLTNFVSWESMFPLHNLPRDPFGPLLAPSSAPPETVPPEVALTLQAVSIEPGKSFAVINGRVLAVGELIGPYVVENVTATEVWLKHAAGRKVLPMEFARPTPATPKLNPSSSPKS